MLGAKTTTHERPIAYATGADFCRIFETHMDRFYQLAFLLTGDEAAAEKCFVQGLEDSKGNRVFKEWAESWARRTIVQTAIRSIAPKPENNRTGSPKPHKGLTAIGDAILALPDFERFVFVMSVLEGYSDQECALLLDCMRMDVTAARTQAVQRMGAIAGSCHKPLNRNPGKDNRNQDNRKKAALGLELGIFPRLAASL